MDIVKIKKSANIHKESVLTFWVACEIACFCVVEWVYWGVSHVWNIFENWMAVLLFNYASHLFHSICYWIQNSAFVIKYCIYQASIFCAYLWHLTQHHGICLLECLNIPDNIGYLLFVLFLINSFSLNLNLNFVLYFCLHILQIFLNSDWYIYDFIDMAAESLAL